MRRVVWVAIGAAGGIIAYRRAQQALAEAREQGLVLSAQQVGVSAVGALNGARSLATGLIAPSPTPAPLAPGAAAARVLGQRKQGE